MRLRFPKLLLAACIAALPYGAVAAVQLHELTPGRKAASVRFEPLEGAASAALVARISRKDGLSEIEISRDGLQPALLYGGSVACYVLWAVDPGGTWENLGEIGPGARGRSMHRTARASFALLVTAERHAHVPEPSGLVAFRAVRPSGSGAFGFEPPGALPRIATRRIADAAWTAGASVELLQARRGLEVAREAGAERDAAGELREAQEAMATAEAEERAAPGKGKGAALARRSFEMAGQAILIADREAAMRRGAGELAGLRADVEAAQGEAAESDARAGQAEDRANRAEEQVVVIREARDRLREEVAELSGMSSLLEEQKARLRSELRGALSHVAETRETARGMVLSLPDILFDSNKATLKEEARVVIAKLCGILIVISELRVRIEGHTDARGSADYNRELSQERADSVREFMISQGVEGARIEAIGFGIDQPIADNDTATGRRKNRRVELVISGG